jgi:hypothetical protein
VPRVPCGDRVRRMSRVCSTRTCVRGACSLTNVTVVLACNEGVSVYTCLPLYVYAYRVSPHGV